MTVSANTDFNVALNNLKQTYSKDMDDNRPAFAVLQELLPPNRDGIEVGDKINFPVVLSHQGGESYGTSGSVATLRTPVSIEIKDAQTDQYEITQVVRIPFGMISKAQQSPKARFADKARLLVLTGQKGAKRSLELSLLHGANSLGKVSAVASSGAVSGGFARDITFSAQSWSDGIWGAADNLPFDFYSALSAGTKRNSTVDCTVTAVDFANRKVTFFSTVQAELDAILVNDFVYTASSYANQMPGLMSILATVSGTLLGIATTYTMWKAKQVTVTGPITFGKLISGISPAVSHGADGELTALVSPRNYADLVKDGMSARRLDASYKEKVLENGAQSIEYKYSGGKIDIVLHPFMKDGEVAVIPLDNFYRVGSDPDPTMKLADLSLQVMSGTSNTFEFRFWCASAIIPNVLGTSVLFTGITPNAS